MNIKAICLSALIVISGNICFAFDLEKGPYDVRFKTFETYDDSRHYIVGQDTIARPLLIHFWYPSAEKIKDTSLAFKDYIDLIALRENFSRNSSEVSESSFNFVSAYSGFAKQVFGLDTSITTQQILDCPVSSKSGEGNILAGQLPLIIYAPSNSKSSVQNHMICEYLASHGFMIISVGSAGPSSLQRPDLKESTMAQVEDMEFILRYLENKADIGYSNLGLFGFSSGSQATAIFQMRNKKVKAVFSMDGGHEYGAYMALFGLEDFKLKKTNVPYCLVVNNYENFSIYPYYNSIRTADKQMFRMPYLDHNGFVSYWRFFDSCSGEPLSNQTSISYDYISDCALGFFNKYLKPDQWKSDGGEISYTDNNYIQPLIQNNSSIAELCNLILSDNKDLVTKQLSENQIRYSAMENEISILSRMIMDHNTDYSIQLCLYNVAYHPDSWQAYFDLGNARMKKGEKEESKNALLKALELNPENADISKLLDELNQW